MSTPIYKMQEIGMEFIENYQSDLIWDGYLMGKYSNEETQKYIWMIRKTGTHLFFLPERKRLKGIFNLMMNEHKGGTEMRFFFIENPTKDENNGGKLFELSADATEILMESGTLNKYPESI